MLKTVESVNVMACVLPKLSGLKVMNICAKRHDRIVCSKQTDEMAKYFVQIGPYASLLRSVISELHRRNAIQ